MPRLRVLVVGPLPPPFGGVQLIVDMQLRSALAREFDLYAVDTSKHRLRWAVESPGAATPLYFLRDFSRLVRGLARVRPHAVLVHAAAGVSFLRDWVFMVTARLAGARVVCHYHGTLHARFPSFGTRLGRAVGRILMSTAHRIIVLSPTYHREMGQAWKRELVWVPNMADITLFSDVPADSPASWLAPGDRAVLFVGRLSAPKGLYDLFEAIPYVLKRHPKARFVLVGVAENDAMEPAIRADAERRGIAPRITFLGSLEGREKAAAFAASQMIVVPSWTEGFPLVIPEAMAAGLPVIASAVGAIPDFVKEGRDGFLIAPKAPLELADRICRLMDDEKLRRQISERVSARAPREFAIEIGCGKVSQVIAEVLGSAPHAMLHSEARDRY